MKASGNNHSLFYLYVNRVYFITAFRASAHAE